MVALAYDSEMEPLPLLVHVDDAPHEYPTEASSQQPAPSTASFDEPVSAISRNSFFTSAQLEEQATLEQGGVVHVRSSWSRSCPACR